MDFSSYEERSQECPHSLSHELRVRFEILSNYLCTLIDKVTKWMSNFEVCNAFRFITIWLLLFIKKTNVILLFINLLSVWEQCDLVSWGSRGFLSRPDVRTQLPSSRTNHHRKNPICCNPRLPCRTKVSPSRARKLFAWTTARRLSIIIHYYFYYFCDCNKYSIVFRIVMRCFSLTKVFYYFNRTTSQRDNLLEDSIFNCYRFSSLFANCWRDFSEFTSSDDYRMWYRCTSFFTQFNCQADDVK